VGCLLVPCAQCAMELAATLWRSGEREYIVLISVERGLFIPLMATAELNDQSCIKCVQPHKFLHITRERPAQTPTTDLDFPQPPMA